MKRQGMIVRWMMVVTVVTVVTAAATAPQPSQADGLAPLVHLGN